MGSSSDFLGLELYLKFACCEARPPLRKDFLFYFILKFSYGSSKLFKFVGLYSLPRFPKLLLDYLDFIIG